MKYSAKGYSSKSVLILIMFLLITGRALYSQTGRNDSITFYSASVLKKLVKENSLQAKKWWNAWLIGYGAATVVQSGIAITSDELTVKQDMWNGAATTFLGVAGLLLTPLVPGKSELNKIVREGKETGHIYTDSDLYSALLKEIARREKFGRSWKVHAVTLVVNAGSGLVTWLAFDRSFSDGLVIFAINTAVTETQIWTQPVRAVRDYERYIKTVGNGIHARQEGTTRTEAPPRPSPKWYFSASPGGAALRIRF